MTQKPSAFADRLEYLIWLRHLTTGASPSNRQIAEAANMTGPAATAWRRRDEVPDSVKVVEALIAYFGIRDYREWFTKNDSAQAPPRPDLWETWIKERAEKRPNERKKPTEDDFKTRQASKVTRVAGRRRP